MPVTIKQAAAMLDRSAPMVGHYIRAGLVRVIEKGRGARSTLVDADDVKRLAATLKPREEGVGRPRQKDSRGPATDEVKRARQRLLEALAQACTTAGLGRDEVEARLCCFIDNLGDHIESRLWHRQNDSTNVISHKQL